MAGLSNYLENAVLNWMKGTDFPSAPATVYVALFDGDPTDAGTGGSEVTTDITGSANRTALSWSEITDDGSGNQQMSNLAEVEITASAAGAATADHAAIFDAITGGNMLASVAISSMSVTSGVRVYIIAGGLVFKIG